MSVHSVSLPWGHAIIAIHFKCNSLPIGRSRKSPGATYVTQGRKSKHSQRQIGIWYSFSDFANSTCMQLSSEGGTHWRYPLDPPILMYPYFIDIDVNYYDNMTLFIFQGKYYEQVQGAPMKSPISPVVANLFIEDFVARDLSSSRTHPAGAHNNLFLGKYGPPRGDSHPFPSLHFGTCFFLPYFDTKLVSITFFHQTWKSTVSVDIA